MYWWGLWGSKHQESFPLHMKDTFQVETQKPLRHQEVSVDICQYLLYHLRMYFLYLARVSVYTIHTPPEGWVRAKKFCITYDTNFGRYLPRGTIIDGSQKCRIRAFCTIAKISGEMPKKGLKTGRNGVKFFLGPHTCWIITFVAIFYFQYFSFWYL